jgi:hypothetical protein
MALLVFPFCAASALNSQTFFSLVSYRCCDSFYTADAWQRTQIEYVQGDISDREAVMNICKGAACVWHIAAAVGPYHPEELYTKVRVDSLFCHLNTGSNEQNTLDRKM